MVLKMRAKVAAVEPSVYSTLCFEDFFLGGGIGIRVSEIFGRFMVCGSNLVKLG